MKTAKSPKTKPQKDLKKLPFWIDKSALLDNNVFLCEDYIATAHCVPAIGPNVNIQSLDHFKELCFDTEKAHKMIFALAQSGEKITYLDWRINERSRAICKAFHECDIHFSKGDGIIYLDSYSKGDNNQCINFAKHSNALPKDFHETITLDQEFPEDLEGVFNCGSLWASTQKCTYFNTQPIIGNTKGLSFNNGTNDLFSLVTGKKVEC
jgi:hypothetical protein